MPRIMKLLLTLLFGEAGYLSAAADVLICIGLWGVFKKCGVKPWRALIPCLKYYDLALCAAREPEGRVLFMTSVLTTLGSAAALFIPESNRIWVVVGSLDILVYVVETIFLIRVIIVLLEVFDAKKRWLFLAIPFTSIFLVIFGLEPVAGSMVSKLSGGQRKRLSIAMEFISNPSLFILDEPDSGLDGVMARELFEQLRNIADQGKIIIVITHTPDRVIDLFDDVIVLAKDANRTGRLAFFGSIDDARAFFGKQRMEEIVMSVNRKEEGGEGRADEFIEKYAEVQHA